MKRKLTAEVAKLDVPFLSPTLDFSRRHKKYF